jgi:phosphate transport system permease protein
MNDFWRKGEPFIWTTAAALATTLLLAAVLIVVVLVNGLGVFWPSRVAVAELHDGSRVMGEVIRREAIFDGEGQRVQFKIGNRDLYGLDFRWVDQADIARMSFPDAAIVLERQEYGNFYGSLAALEGQPVTGPAQGWTGLRQRLQELAGERDRIAEMGGKLADLNGQVARLRMRERKLLYRGLTAEDARVASLQTRREALERQFHELADQQSELISSLRQRTATFVDVSGSEREMPLVDIVRPYQPNRMSLPAKVAHYAGKLWELLSAEPRESNTEGGLFPAIFGTVMLIFVMSLFSFPLGVLAAIYLREYAKEGLIVRMVRIAVNNLAGIPSIVYGIFGLAFFVYGIGGSIDQLFFPERLPDPTFGTGGILWASLTLSLLTVPVVIVATEEALGAIPNGVRDGSLALGATKFQTLTRILLPMASPGIMTGLILAMARAAGEVAPLMITGVVKLAPSLPLDGQFPFLHLDRKFMHLGFHIYDIGFQSPNVEAAKPMVFVTTLLLVLIVLVMSSVAIRLRNKMKKRYTYSTF